MCGNLSYGALVCNLFNYRLSEGGDEEFLNLPADAFFCHRMPTILPVAPTVIKMAGMELKESKQEEQALTGRAFLLWVGFG